MDTSNLFERIEGYARENFTTETLAYILENDSGVREGGWPRLKSEIHWHDNRGEDITATLLGKVWRGGGCPRFGLGTWVLGSAFLFAI
jgi:hypothetical protein